MKKILNSHTMTLLTGVLVGAALFGGGTVLASSGVMANPSAQTIYVDGQQVNMTAYTIGGNNYVKLRDVGKAVDFSVRYDAATQSVQIDSDAPYVEEVQTPVKEPQTPVQGPAVPSGQPYIIHTDHWSREDFSQQANPAVFTGIYDRALYNTLRQTIVDLGTDNNAGGNCAYTMVAQNNYGTVKRFVGRLDGVTRYEHYVPQNITNYYAYPSYFAVAAKTPETYQDRLTYIQPVLAEANELQSDSEKVRYLNDYLCTKLDYRVGTTAGVARIFSDHEEGLTGSCGSYAVAFNFLCSAADIPCMMIGSSDHTWNLVYADGQWLHVDAAANDTSGQNYILLSKTHPNSSDIAPDATAFLKELLIPGSTK